LSLRHYQAEVTRYRNFCNGFIKRHQEVGELLPLLQSRNRAASSSIRLVPISDFLCGHHIDGSSSELAALSSVWLRRYLNT
jgi:hypothetical protein